MLEIEYHNYTKYKQITTNQQNMRDRQTHRHRERRDKDRHRDRQKQRLSERDVERKRETVRQSG